ncbi:MAG: D-alanine--D-alanine ligase [Gammaproteobacteria bacterium]
MPHKRRDIFRVVADAGRVAVLMGGHSGEREISLKSGQSVLDALLRAGVDAHALVWDGNLVDEIASCSPDRVFVALHGRGGEDGTVQGLLEMLGLPYTGSGVLGCALSMDKVRSKQIWRALGLPTPDFHVLRRDERAGLHLPEVGLPAMVKPASEGSSLGVSRVTETAALAAAVAHAMEFDDVILIEQWIDGGEYTMGIVDDEPLPIIKLETPHEFYDYDAKYVADTTRYLCPCGLSDVLLESVTSLAVDAFAALGASGWGRVDFMLDGEGYPWLIELNTVPGMTDHSLVPMAAAAAGMDFEELVVRILATSMEAP